MSRSIFRSLLIVVALFILTSSVSAQVRDTNFRRFSIGPYVIAGASVFSGEVPYTWKTAVKFAWSGGAVSTFATSPKFAINLGLGYDSRRIFFHQEDNKEITTEITFSTLDVMVGAKFNDFIIGFNFGFPMAGEMNLDDGAGKTLTAGPSHFTSDSLKMKIEPYIGALFNIVESEAGKLQFMIKASYPLTDMWEHIPYSMRQLHPPGTASDIEVQSTPVGTNERRFEDGVVPSLQLGFAYQFNLGGKY